MYNLKLSSNFKHFLHILWPVRVNFKIFLYYRAAVEEITDINNGLLTKYIKIMCFLVRVRVSQLLFLYLFENDLIIEQKIALFDYIFFLQLPNEIKLIFSVIVIMCEYVFRKVYFFEGSKFLCDFILFPVIFDKKNKYLLLPKSQINIVISKILNILKLYLYVFQVIVTSFIFWYFFQEFTLYRAAKTFLDSSQMTYNICILVCAHLNFSLDLLITFSLCGVLHLVSAYLLVVTLIFFTRLNVLNERFTQMAYLNYHYTRLSRDHVHTLVHIVRANDLIKRVIFAMILVDTPTNTYFLVALFTKELSTITVIFFYAIFTSQVFAIFCFHALFARYSVKLHAHWRPLLRWYVCKSRTKSKNQLSSLYSQMKVSRKLETFLVKSSGMYGIWYGNVSLVTLKTFAKVCQKCFYVFNIYFLFLELHYLLPICYFQF